MPASVLGAVKCPALASHKVEGPNPSPVEQFSVSPSAPRAFKRVDVRHEPRTNDDRAATRPSHGGRRGGVGVAAYRPRGTADTHGRVPHGPAAAGKDRRGGCRAGGV